MTTTFTARAPSPRLRQGSADPAVEVVSGGAEILDAEGKVRHRLVRQREIALTLPNMLMGAPLPNARFFRRSFYDRWGSTICATPSPRIAIPHPRRPRATARGGGGADFL